MSRYVTLALTENVKLCSLHGFKYLLFNIHCMFACNITRLNAPGSSVFLCYLRHGGYVLSGVCLPVCLSLCKNHWSDLAWKFYQRCIFGQGRTVRYCLLHVHLLPHVEVHLHHRHYHHFHPLSLVHSFIMNWRLGSLANHFHHRPFPYLLDWFYGLSAHLTFLFCATAGFVCTVC